jgi:hydroxyacylglutathione hydrolase
MSSQILTHTGGFTETNGYLLKTPQGNWIAVDAPGDFLEFCLTRNIRPIALLLTHSHFDHVIDAAKLVAEAECPVYAQMVSTPDSRLETVFAAMNLRADEYPVTHLLKHGDQFQVDGVSFQVFHVPGHSPDSLVFYTEEHKLAFTGDTLMEGTTGRTDFPGGGAAILLRHIQDHILSLPNDTAVLAGHLGLTSVGAERAMIEQMLAYKR